MSYSYISYDNPYLSPEEIAENELMAEMTAFYEENYEVVIRYKLKNRSPGCFLMIPIKV